MLTYKTYVAVRVTFAPDGRMFPRALSWEDGRTYTIDRVLSVRPGYAAKAGGQGDKYTVSIGGKQTHLFFERSTSLTAPTLGRWFVERKHPTLDEFMENPR